MCAELFEGVPFALKTIFIQASCTAVHKPKPIGHNILFSLKVAYQFRIHNANPIKQGQETIDSIHMAGIKALGVFISSLHKSTEQQAPYKYCKPYQTGC
jgi:hypothetical protein